MDPLADLLAFEDPTLTADLDFFTSRLRLGLDTTQMVDTFVYVALTRMIKADVKMVIGKTYHLPGILFPSRETVN